MATTSADTDASRWEYVTYAPRGEICPECEKPITSLDLCRRGYISRPDAPPVAVYKHTDCPEG